MDFYGIEEARKNLGEIVDRARFASEHVLITRSGKPAAVIVSAEWYEQARAAAGADSDAA